MAFDDGLADLYADAGPSSSPESPYLVAALMARPERLEGGAAAAGGGGGGGGATAGGLRRARLFEAGAFGDAWRFGGAFDFGLAAALTGLG